MSADETLPRFGAVDVDFVNTDIESIKSEIISELQETFGRNLDAADPVRLIALTMAAPIAQTRILANMAIKQQTLLYAEGAQLDTLGAAYNVSRAGSVAASVYLQFSRGEGGGMVVIQPGELVVSGAGFDWVVSGFSWGSGDTTSPLVAATCTTLGTDANGVQRGEITTISQNPNQRPFTVTNVTVSAGGEDSESDLDYATRIRLKFDSFSCAGPQSAYLYYAKSASADIEDVSIDVPRPCYASLYVLKKGGIIPPANDPVILAIKDALGVDSTDSKVRPCTDIVHVLPCGEVGYTFEVYPSSSFYVAQDAVDLYSYDTVVENVKAAFADWVVWTRSKMGRAVDVTRLVSLMQAAGAISCEASLANQPQKQYMQVSVPFIATTTQSFDDIFGECKGILPR